MTSNNLYSVLFGRQRNVSLVGSQRCFDSVERGGRRSNDSALRGTTARVD